MAVTIADVAKRAHVSPAVVSRVIHESGYVSKEKREAVEAALKELSYIPNQIAQGLKKHRTKVIGHILPSTYPNPFFAKVSYGVDTEAYNQGYHVLTLFSNSDAVREKRLIDEMVSRMVDGIIFTGAVSEDNVNRIKEKGLPIVMVERDKEIMGVDKVLVDNTEGSYNAVMHLIGKGHKRIGCIAVKAEGDVEYQRYEGYLRALKNSSITLDETIVRHADNYRPDTGYSLMEDIILRGNIPSAIFCSSDLLAIGVLQCLYRYRLRVPDDISLIGYDNTYARYMSPKLTTVANPTHELGRTAVKLIIDRIEKNDSIIKTVTLHTNLIERDSVKHI